MSVEFITDKDGAIAYRDALRVEITRTEAELATTRDAVAGLVAAEPARQDEIMSEQKIATDLIEYNINNLKHKSQSVTYDIKRATLMLFPVDAIFTINSD